MKFVHFADLHLDTQFQWADARIALRDTLRRILDLAADVRADAILSAGDLCEQERFSPDTRCPCHGGAYDVMGNMVEGPPPAALHRLDADVAGGTIFVDRPRAVESPARR